MSAFDNTWRAQALIDIQSLNHNVERIRAQCGAAKIMAVIKANAYGHGLKTISGLISDKVDGFAVATLAEAAECRDVQKDKPIVVLSEWWHRDQIALFFEYDLQPVVHSPEQLEWLSDWPGQRLNTDRNVGPNTAQNAGQSAAESLSGGLDVWLKIDTGMNRLGIPAKDGKTAHAQLSKIPWVKQVRILSHLANADDDSDGVTDQQIALLEEITLDILGEKSLCNSAGLLQRANAVYEWVRPGLMLYGASAVTHQSVSSLDLKPVMHLKARILSIKEIEKDCPVGYGGTAITQRKTRIGMVGVGYGDGYPRVVDERACVLIKGIRAPFIGRVSMDMITIDVTDLSDVAMGDEVTLWGPGLNVDEVADWANTIPYELLCKVTMRIPRVVHHG